MFGVPSIRARLLGLGGSSSEQPETEAKVGGEGRSSEQSPSPEVEAALEAIDGLSIAGMAKAEVGLQRAIDAGAEGRAGAALKMAQAELLASRSLAYAIAAAIDVDQRASLSARAAADQQAGERIAGSIEGAADTQRLARVRAVARLAAGRDLAEVTPMVPEDASELGLVVRAAPLWRNLEAPVPDGLTAELQALSTRSGLADAVLVLALLRSGQTEAAHTLGGQLSADSSDHIVGRVLSAAPSSEGEGVAKAPPVPLSGEGEPVNGSGGPGSGGSDSGGSGSGGSGGSRFDNLLEKGCGQVESGEGSAGVQTLLKAFDIKPKNLDVLVCLGTGYAAQGSNARAGQFFDRALKQVPNHRAALAGAAKVAAKTGAETRAKKLYTRLLEVDPGNAAADAYLSKADPPKPEDPDPKPAPEPEAPAASSDTGD